MSALGYIMLHMATKTIRRLRLEAGLKQQTLADKAKLNRVSVNRIENGLRVPKPDSMKRIARALGVKIADISWGVCESFN